MTDLHGLSINAFCDVLRGADVKRFALTWDRRAERVRASHPALEPLARFIESDERDFDRHEGWFGHFGPRTGVLQTACVHRTRRGQGAGGVRFWSYDTVEDLVRDGLRLAMGMTHKNALASLWWGGGKGVMVRGTGKDDGSPEVRRAIYEDYGDLVTSLRGCYVTAEDVGTSVEDMAAIFSRTRFVTCIPPELGGSGNPSVPTARGVVAGMEAALEHLGMGALEGKSVAIQGLGHVGEPLVGFLRDKGVTHIVGSDVDPTRERRIRGLFPDLDLEIHLVERANNDIMAADVDVIAPCATGGILNPATIATMKAKIVCGAANNQLEDPLRDDLLLDEAGVLYMPDFLVNRMGIVACADEGSGYVTNDPVIERHLGREWEGGIYRLSMTLLARARAQNVPLARVALEEARERSFEHHPLALHRGMAIIESLVADEWARSGRTT